MVKTKIISTLGPSSESPTVLRKMMLAGMDVARLNFSHGTHTGHQNKINIIKELNKKYRRHIRILQDLEGFRIRVGKFVGSKKTFELKKKAIVRFTNKGNLKDKSVIPLDYDGPLSDIKTGTYIFIDDGNIALLVKQRTRNYIKAEVTIAGILKEKGTGLIL